MKPSNNNAKSTKNVTMRGLTPELHVVWEIAVNYSNKSIFPYHDAAAHELAHVRAFYRRLVAMVDHYNLRAQPCYSDPHTCYAKTFDWEQELNNSISWMRHGEENHDVAAGFGTPSAGEAIKWQGVYDD